MSAPSLHPLVQWAQRETFLYLTIEVDKIDDLTVTAKDLHVKGKYGGSDTLYETKIEFYADVKTEYRRIDNDRHLEIVLNKDVSSWWPRLLKQQGKVAWVKVDFNKWKDEDEEDDDVDVGGGGMPGGFDFNNYMASMGGGEGGNAVPNLDDFEDEDGDEDANMPDLEDAIEADKKVAKEEEEKANVAGADGDKVEQKS